MRPHRHGDEAVAGVVAAVLLLAALVGFLAVVNVAWMPVWVQQHEAAAAAELRSALTAWGDEAEDHAARALLNRSFDRDLPVGVEGIPVLGAGASSGRVALDAGPSLVVSLAGAPVGSASGALLASTGAQRFPAQQQRYALGAVEVRQGDEAWADLRGVLTVHRAPRGELGLAVEALSITGATQATGSGRDAPVRGTLAEASVQTFPGGPVRLLFEGIHGPAWRGAAERVLHAAGLQGESRADCGASTLPWCWDTDTTDADSADLHLRNVAAGWTLALGSIRAEVRT